MKNQYFGDVGDYGKYGMLRYFAKNNIKIAVNWYLTPDDGSNDGRHITYLEKNSMARYDPELFATLKQMVFDEKRNVMAFESLDMIPNAVYYNRLLNDEGVSRIEKRAFREKWHKDALSACRGAELVFLDPDNGACEKEPKSTKDSMKYCYADEIADYFYAGQNVVYYCSKGRRTFEQWEETKALMQRRIPESRIAVITFHKGTQRSYIFVLHREYFRKYAELIKSFLRCWYNIFTEEWGKVGKLDGEKTGERFHVLDSRGIELTIEECEDGWVDIHFSDQKNMLHRISIDHLFSRLR